MRWQIALYLILADPIIALEGWGKGISEGVVLTVWRYSAGWNTELGYYVVGWTPKGGHTGPLSFRLQESHVDFLAVGVTFILLGFFLAELALLSVVAT